MGIKTGIIGCGKISGAYFKHAKLFPALEVVACADRFPEAAKEKAVEFGVKAMSVEALLTSPDIELVLNLTTPESHAPINQAALRAGKHAYCEKPFALDRKEAKATLALAKKKGLRIGCAPDTFLGVGLQTCREVLDEGRIGKPVGGVAVLMSHGHESWHPNPDFYYRAGGGPLLDMGPYYLTALVFLLGPVAKVHCAADRAFDTRTIAGGPRAGEKVPVTVNTHYSGTLTFAFGAIVSLIMSFDVWKHGLPKFELYGTEGSLSLPDPNAFAGPVKLFRPGMTEWRDVAPAWEYEAGRGIGPADLAAAAESGRPHRCSGELAYHVLDVMLSLEEAAASGRTVTIKTAVERPAPFPAGLKTGRLD